MQREMINEVTVLQANKNMFGKVLAELRKNKYKAHEELIKGAWYIHTGVHNIQLRVSFAYNIGKIFTVQEPGMVFFCAELTTRLDKFYDGDDPALAILNDRKTRVGRRTGIHTLNKGLEDALIKDGISSRSSSDEVKKCSVYVQLSKVVDGIRNLNFKLELIDEVQKRLKTRENIIPLIIYKVEEGSFNFPKWSLPSGSPNATSCRCTISKSEVDLFNSMCVSAIQYTPYIR